MGPSLPTDFSRPPVSLTPNPLLAALSLGLLAVALPACLRPLASIDPLNMSGGAFNNAPLRSLLGYPRHALVWTACRRRDSELPFAPSPLRLSPHFFPENESQLAVEVIRNNMAVRQQNGLK
ncbi:hypothetical protein V8D89_013267 [Ganoderma adspersum]